jgi:hypothetical protein
MFVLEVTPFIDVDASIKLKKGQRAPKGWRVTHITADCLPAGWPKGKPYPCKCGCGHTFRVGDRMAVKNPRVVPDKPSFARVKP